MEKDVEKAFWDELKILQVTIDKFDDLSFRIKNWFLTIFMAITGYAVVNKRPILLWLNFAVIVIFYIYEITYRARHGDFLQRSREVQKFLRIGDDVANDSKPPYLDKYFPHDPKNIPDKSLFCCIQRRLNIDETEARVNTYEWRTIKQQFSKMLFQPRVSWPYLATFCTNVIILVLLYILRP